MSQRQQRRSGLHQAAGFHPGFAMGAANEIDAERLDAILLDLDGVVTDTAALHAQAWKETFDVFLRAHAEQTGDPFRPFDIGDDYREFVDGKPRYDGVRDFLASRGIHLPEGTPDDPPKAGTVCGLGNRKNARFTELLAERGPHVFEGSVKFLKDVRARGLKTAIVSSSRNCGAVVAGAGITDMFDTQVDGNDIAALKLHGKPAPDMFVEAARRLKVPVERSAVIEDALVGVEAGHSGGFGLVVGVARAADPGELKAHGADIVVDDLAALHITGMPDVSETKAVETAEGLMHRIAGRHVAVFLDYDGTLTPIVDRPELATLSDDMRAVLRRLAQHCTVAVVSGRDLANVEQKVGIETLFYAGSHGFDISGPGGQRFEHPEGARFAAAAAEAAREVTAAVASVNGALVESKHYATAVHYRLVPANQLADVEAAVDAALARHPELRKAGGKKVFELRPRLDWDKGKAVLWLLHALDLDRPDVLPIYIGDDETDEDAFRAIKAGGIGVRVGEPVTGVSSATAILPDVASVGRFLTELADALEAA
jgi:trehalose 6-phosphate phosphatase